MYTPAPSEHELAASGMTAEDLECEPVEVWPENERAFLLFAEIRTQWRVGAMGPTGLDYGVLFLKMDRMKLEPDEYDELEADIRTMEFEALAAMSKRE